MKSFLAFAAAALMAASAVAADDTNASGPDLKAGAQLYEQSCAACHAAGVAGAPKLGDKAAWGPRIDEGMDAMMDIAINGKGAMPPRGATQASDDELKDAVLYMAHEADPDALEKLGVGDESGGSDDKADEKKADDEAAAGDDKTEKDEAASDEKKGSDEKTDSQDKDDGADKDEKSDEDQKADEGEKAGDDEADGEKTASFEPDLDAGKKLYEQTCAACHGTGAAGAPKLGDKGEWDPRIAEGMGAMMDIAINGKGAMPPRGASQASDDELKNAVLYMVHETDPDAMAKLDLDDNGSSGGDKKAEGKESDDEKTADAGEADSGEVDLDAGEQAYKQTCAACHGDDGNSSVPTQPHLAEQHPEYTAKQLHDFKDGKRKDAIMAGMSQGLSDADIRNISAWLGEQKAKPGFSEDEELAEAGQKIWRAGLANRNVPGCAACHSPNGAGIPSQYPRLAGQFAEYTTKQLEEFGDNTRANSEVMHDVAIYLTASEIKAVSDFIAGLR